MISSERLWCHLKNVGDYCEDRYLCSAYQDVRSTSLVDPNKDNPIPFIPAASEGPANGDASGEQVQLKLHEKKACVLLASLGC